MPNKARTRQKRCVQQQSYRYQKDTTTVHTGHLFALTAIFIATADSLADLRPVVPLTLFALALLYYLFAVLPRGRTVQRWVREVRGT